MANEQMIEEEDPIVYYSKQELEPSYCMDEEMDNYLIWFIIIKFSISHYSTQKQLWQSSKVKNKSDQQSSLQNFSGKVFNALLAIYQIIGTRFKQI